MRHWIVAPIIMLVQIVVLAQSPRLEFDVASIRRASGNVIGVSPSANTGHILLRSTTARGLVLTAYPIESIRPEVVGLPGWADKETYDVEVKTTPGHTRDELQQMWRTLLADRMKLSAHYETRDLPSYDLVLARGDRKLGPNLRLSRLDCSQPQAPPRLQPGVDIKQMALSVCSRAFSDRDGTT